LAEDKFTSFIESYRSFTVIPDTSIDSLISAGILLKNLIEHGWDVRVNLDPKVIIDYPNDPAILINLKPINEQRHLPIETTRTSSVTAILVNILEKSIGGVSKWDKILAILSGLYRGYYDFKGGGFKGAEDSILRELESQRVVSEIVGLRAWGSKRKSLVTALTRTLVPFIPGITGNPENASKLISEVYGVSEPLSVRQKEVTSEDEVKRVSELVKRISELSRTYAKRDLQLQLKLVGDFYVQLQEHSVTLELEAHESIGGLMVYESSCRDCVLDIVLLPLSVDILPQVLAISNNILDYIAVFLSNQIVEFLSSNGRVFECDENLQRPDIIVDILLYHDLIPEKDPVRFLCNGEEVSVLRELLRVSVKPEEAYAKCMENQLCRVQ
jgi:single-stranded-DNA-specific exonuclease